jgi:hypothetical protein
VKEHALRTVFATVGQPRSIAPKVAAAVLGCADKRFMPHHRRLLEVLFGKPVDMTTFDITIEHLQGEQGVVQHDATMPLPGGPFDFVLGDVLVRFASPDRQFFILKNAYDALGPGGMAVFNFARDDFDPKPGYVPPAGTFPVDFNALQMQLTNAGIQYQEVPLHFDAPGPDGNKLEIDEMALVLRKT